MAERTPVRIALVGCSVQKDCTPAPARHLYTSQLFRAGLAVAERHCPGRTLVLSALHGAVDLERVLAPYDYALQDAAQWERVDWGHVVLHQVQAWLEQRGLSTDAVELHVYAGRAYAEPLRWQLPEWPGWSVVEPLAGLGVGLRLAALAALARQRPGPVQLDFDALGGVA